MAWFKKPKYTIVKPEKKSSVPEGTFAKCEDCGEVMTKKQVEENLNVCPACNHHMHLEAQRRIESLIDEGTWNEHALTVASIDPLEFPGYPDKLARAKDKTGMEEGIRKGDGLLDGKPVALGITDFRFMGGSMASVLGEELTLLMEFAREKRMPLITVSTSGGGARMQEGILSLMQMAKTSAALARLSDAGVPYISILAHPTGGGVTASWAVLGDLNIAEPDALIMFAGARVIEQTIRQRLPKGFQRSEFLQEHGVLDMVVSRADMKQVLSKSLDYLKPVSGAAAPGLS